MYLPKKVTIVDVSPRDGLQSETQFVPTEKKIGLIKSLIDAGIPKIELTSFVSPKWVPQMADAEDLVHAVGDAPVAFQVLIPNEKGYERARLTGKIKEITIVVAATETLNRRNVNMSIEDSMRQFARIAERARADGVRVRGSIGVAFVCPYEGRVSLDHSSALADRLFGDGADEVALADTLGAAVPNQVFELFDRVKQKWPEKALAGHFHDTEQLALSNILAAMQAGADVFDASVGNLGGCQFTKGAKGNVATERVVYMLQGMGIETGIDLQRLAEVAAAAKTLVASPTGQH
ncbi:MAG TPA: hydroxymethylglutaryl-CoA lyase [Blastocatellia bacterium]